MTVGKKEMVAFDSSNVEKNESLKGTCANCHCMRVAGTSSSREHKYLKNEN